jgi:hypothetical protein
VRQLGNRSVATCRPGRDNLPAPGGGRTATLGCVSGRVKENNTDSVRIHQCGKPFQIGGKPWWPHPLLNEVSASAAKHAWGRLIKQVYEVDPLVCPTLWRNCRTMPESLGPSVLEVGVRMILREP